MLIQRYFDGETSLDEERNLLNELLSIPSGDPLADEALAVIGFTKIDKGESRVGEGNYGRRRHGFISVAAACVAVVVVGAGILSYFIRTGNSFANEECVAYVGGERIESESAVMSLIAGQLDEMSDASASVEKEIDSDLGDIREIMDFD